MVKMVALEVEEKVDIQLMVVLVLLDKVLREVTLLLFLMLAAAVAAQAKLVTLVTTRMEEMAVTVYKII